MHAFVLLACLKELILNETNAANGYAQKNLSSKAVIVVVGTTIFK